MKSQKTIKKLELKKETIVRLGENDLRSFIGGDEPITGHHNTCVCVTFTTRKEPCIK